jgi:thymidylate synthase ThyX
VLPLCLETQFIWTGSLDAFLHLWKLRLKPDAQKETRDVAFLMLDEIRKLPNNPFKLTLDAFKIL